MMEVVDNRNFLEAEEKRGFLWNLVDTSGPSDQPHQIYDDNTRSSLRFCLPHWEQKSHHLFKDYRYPTCTVQIQYRILLFNASLKLR